MKIFPIWDSFTVRLLRLVGILNSQDSFGPAHPHILLESLWRQCENNQTRVVVELVCRETRNIKTVS